MALDTLRRDKIEGGLALSYQQLTELFPEAKAVPQVQFDLKCASAVVLKRFDPGEILCEEGDFGSTAFFLVSGKVNVFISSRANTLSTKQPSFFSRLFGHARGGETGNVQSMLRQFIATDSGDLALDNPIASLGAGELFGEMTCRNFQPRSATIQAVEQCEVIEMLRVFLDLLLGQTDREPEPEFVYTLGTPPQPKDETPAPIGADGKPLPPPAGVKAHKRPRAEGKEAKHRVEEWLLALGRGQTRIPMARWWLGSAAAESLLAWGIMGFPWRFMDRARRSLAAFHSLQAAPTAAEEEPPAAPSPDHQWRPGEWVWQPIKQEETGDWHQLRLAARQMGEAQRQGRHVGAVALGAHR
jgi:CRP-like cAMP-binding protein